MEQAVQVELPVVMMENTRHLTRAASDAFDDLDFKTDSLYNRQAPDPWITFLIGGLLTTIYVVYFGVRYRRIQRALTAAGQRCVGSLRLRAIISAALDNDETFYTTIKLSAGSFLFLGAIQLNYQLAFLCMLGAYSLESFFDTLRIVIAFREADSLAAYTALNSHIRRKTRNATQLKPQNVYEDLTRERTVVFMVFLTQCLLIGFVVYDIYEKDTHSCHDGTPNCPVGGTFGSWGSYVLGIFMAVVFLVGPKTSFGQSEQNPAFWLKLLLMAKQTGSSVTWYDPDADQILTRKLRKNDWSLWTRFLMSFLINGVGFHILVHALPLQVASQSSLVGIVFRAVGMVYLVDLDDTPGYTMTLVEDADTDKSNNDDDVNGDVVLGTIDENEPDEQSVVVPQSISSFRHDSVSVMLGSIRPGISSIRMGGASLRPDSVRSGLDPASIRPSSRPSEGEMAVLAQQIIQDAKNKLDALAAGQTTGGLTATGALALASGIAVHQQVAGKQGGNDVITTLEDGDPNEVVCTSVREPAECGGEE